MYKDAVSLPDLSEHVLYQFQIQGSPSDSPGNSQGFEEYLKKRSPKTSYTLKIDEEILLRRIYNYCKQDE